MTPERAAEEELHRLRHEEHSLRTVAQLLAAPGPPEDILTALCREISEQLDGQEVSLLRFNPDNYELMATHGGPIPVGVTAPVTAGSLPDRVARTAGVVRVDNFDDEPDAELVRPFGIRAAVGVPVLVEGRVWGMFSASSQGAPLTATAEARLAGFAQLTWAAVATTESRESLKGLVEEQAALRFVAELVARQSALPVVFQAVVDAAARLHSARAVLLRAEADGSRAVAQAGEPPRPHSRLSRVQVLVDDAAWGTLEIVSPEALGPISPDRPKAFADLIAAAISNAQHREGLTQSRARVIAAADDARRRLQRDVHDGAQRRLVHTIITLKIAQASLAGGAEVGDLLAEALAHAEEASRELRDVVRGILPATLTRNGLAAGIESLAADAPLPVALELAIPRLPAAVETTGYFAVAETLTNAAKHSGAARLRVAAVVSGDDLVLTIDDDGVGGADASRGTGLTGLADRIEASDGTLTIVSLPGKGTHVTARIPLPAL